jgi:hypothetical protein
MPEIFFRCDIILANQITVSQKISQIAYPEAITIPKLTHALFVTATYTIMKGAF